MALVSDQRIGPTQAQPVCYW